MTNKELEIQLKRDILIAKMYSLIIESSAMETSNKEREIGNLAFAYGEDRFQKIADDMKLIAGKLKTLVKDLKKR